MVKVEESQLWIERSRVAESLRVTFMWSTEPFSETANIFEDTELETFTIFFSFCY